MAETHPEHIRSASGDPHRFRPDAFNGGITSLLSTESLDERQIAPAMIAIPSGGLLI